MNQYITGVMISALLLGLVIAHNLCSVPYC